MMGNLASTSERTHKTRRQLNSYCCGVFFGLPSELLCQVRHSGVRNHSAGPLFQVARHHRALYLLIYTVVHLLYVLCLHSLLYIQRVTTSLLRSRQPFRPTSFAHKLRREEDHLVGENKRFVKRRGRQCARRRSKEKMRTHNYIAKHDLLHVALSNRRTSMLCNHPQSHNLFDRPPRTGNLRRAPCVIGLVISNLCLGCFGVNHSQVIRMCWAVTGE